MYYANDTYQINAKGYSVYKFLMLLLLISPPAAAEWTMIQSGDNENVYVDFDTLQKQGGMVTISTLNDFYFAQQKKELSTRLTELHDCQSKKFKVLSSTYYSGNMGQGDVIATSSFNALEAPWVEVVRYSVGELKANIICSR